MNGLIPWLFLAAGLTLPLEEILLLDLNGPSSRGRDPVLVRGYVTFREGFARDPSLLQILDDKSRPCPADFIPTTRWKDGSIRSLALKAVVEARLADRKIRLKKRTLNLKEPWSLHAGKSSLTGEVEIDTGHLKVLCSPHGQSLLDSLKVEGREVFQAGKALELRVHLNGTVYRPCHPRTILLCEGSAEAEVIVMGDTASDHYGAGPGYELHLYFYPGSTLVHGRLRVIGDVFEGFSEGIFLHLHALSTRGNPVVRFLDASAGEQVSLRIRDAVRFSAEKGRVRFTSERKEVLYPRGASAGFVSEAKGMSFCLGLPRFGVTHPWDVELSPHKGVSLSLLARDFQWEKGFSFEREFFLKPKKGTAFKSLPSGITGPARAVAFARPGENEFRALPFETQRRNLNADPLFGLFLDVSGKLLAGLAEEWSLWDGFRDFGDYRTAFGQFANCEFDPAFGLIKRFFLTGRLRDMVAAEIMLKHWLRFDRTGPADDSFPAHLPWVHGEDHASGKIELGHMWVDGALLFFRVTGELAYKEAAMTIGQHLVSSGMYSPDGTKERSLAWSLMALTALHEAGLSGFEEGMNRRAAHLRARQSEAGYFRLDTIRKEEVALYAPNAWVTAGITMEALYRHFLLTGDSRSWESVIKAGKWLVGDGLDPVTRRWHQRMYYGQSKDGRLLERSGVVRRDNAVFLALGLARAAHLSGDDRLSALARSALEQGLSDLNRYPPEYPGRALAIVLRCAPDVLMATNESP